MRSLRFLAPVAFTISLALLPQPVAAVTVDQIVALSKAGVSEAVILALLDRDGTVLTIDPDQLVRLKRDGLSDTLIMAMLRNGRAEGEEAARAISEEKAAAILATLPLSASLPAPDLVIVGHGPERPNTAYSSTGFRTSRSKSVYFPPVPAVPYASSLPYTSLPYTSLPYTPVPYTAPLPYAPVLPYPQAVPYVPPYAAPVARVSKANQAKPYQPLMCVAQVNTGGGPGPSYITECPAVMQPRRR